MTFEFEGVKSVNQNMQCEHLLIIGTYMPESHLWRYPAIQRLREVVSGTLTFDNPTQLC